MKIARAFSNCISAGLANEALEDFKKVVLFKKSYKDEEYLILFNDGSGYCNGNNNEYILDNINTKDEEFEDFASTHLRRLLNDINNNSK